MALLRLSTLSRVLNRNENPNPTSLATRFCDAKSPKWSYSQPFKNYRYVFYDFFGKNERLRIYSSRRSNFTGFTISHSYGPSGFTKLSSR